MRFDVGGRSGRPRGLPVRGEGIRIGCLALLAGPPHASVAVILASSFCLLLLPCAASAGLVLTDAALAWPACLPAP